MSQHVPDQELLPDQASFTNLTSSALSTPRSLRPGTVPKLDLSPAIALHMAELVSGEEDEQHADRREDEGAATQRQAAAMASFDDLSGPESPETDREEEEEEATQQAAMTSFNVMPGLNLSHAASEADLLAPATTASHATNESMHAVADSLDDAHAAHHASSASSASSSAKLAAQALGVSAAGTARSSLSVPSAFEAPPVVTSKGPKAVSGEASHSSSPVHQSKTSPSEQAVAASSSTHVSVRATAHTQATAVDPGSIALATQSPALADFAAPTAQLSHRPPVPRSDESSSTASSVSEELDSDFLTQEASPASDHMLFSSEAGPLVSGLDQPAAIEDSALDADDVQLSFGSPEAEPLQAGTLLLQPVSVGVSLLPLLAGNIGKKHSEDKEQRHLAPDLLAYAEAAMTEGVAEAERHPLVSNKAAGEIEAAKAAVLSSTGAVPEAAGHGQQADKIAAELFDELLSDAVHSMTTTGESPLHMTLPHPAWKPVGHPV